MDDRAISLLTNQFCRTALCVGASQVSGTQLALLRCERGWVLTTNERGLHLGVIGVWVPDDIADLHAEFKPIKKAKVFQLPKLDGDDIDTVIALAGTISANLSSYRKGLKSNIKRDPEEAKANARKAINARWHGGKK